MNTPSSNEPSHKISSDRSSSDDAAAVPSAQADSSYSAMEDNTEDVPLVNYYPEASADPARKHPQDPTHSYSRHVSTYLDIDESMEKLWSRTQNSARAYSSSSYPPHPPSKPTKPVYANYPSLTHQVNESQQSFYDEKPESSPYKTDQYTHKPSTTSSSSPAAASSAQFSVNNPTHRADSGPYQTSSSVPLSTPTDALSSSTDSEKLTESVDESTDQFPVESIVSSRKRSSSSPKTTDKTKSKTRKKSPHKRTQKKTVLSHSRPQTAMPQAYHEGGFLSYVNSIIKDTTLSWKLLYKVSILGLTIMMLVCLGLVWNWKSQVDGSFQKVDALDIHSHAIRNRDGQAGDEVFLIVGVDSRSGKNAKVGAGTEDEVQGTRSDTIIMVDIPASHEKVIAVSFPRDLQVDRPECKAWDNETGTYTDEIVPAEQNTKINGAYSYGGPKCLVSIVQNLSGIAINHFIGMDFSGFRYLVNDIGGVMICNREPLIDGELGTILRRTGPHKIYGTTALNYVRARKVISEGNGDYGRIHRQQHFVTSLLRGMLSNQVLSNPAKLNRLIRDFTRTTFVENVSSNILLNLAQEMKGINTGRITILTIPTIGTSTDGAGNEIPNKKSTDALFNAIIDDNPLPGEPDYQGHINTPAPTPARPHTPGKHKRPSGRASTPVKKPTPRNVYSFTTSGVGATPVRVLNASEILHQAKNVADQLGMFGYSIAGIMDSNVELEHTVVHYPPDDPQFKKIAAQIAVLFPHASIQEDSHMAEDHIDLLIGKDVENVPQSMPNIGVTMTVPELAPEGNHVPYDINYTNGADASCLG